MDCGVNSHEKHQFEELICFFGKLVLSCFAVSFECSDFSAIDM